MPEENQRMKLYEIFTTRSKTFFVIAPDPTEAERKLQEFIRKRGLWTQEVLRIDVVAENYDYTQFKMLVL